MSDEEKKGEQEIEEELDREEEEKEKREAEEKRLRKERVRQKREEAAKKAAEKKGNDDTEVAPKVAIRDDVVNSCINFLNHPKVISSPKSQKVSFLRKKGLTEEEIQEAFNRAGSSASSTAMVSSPSTSPVPYSPKSSPPPQTSYPQPPYPYPYPPPPPQNPHWYQSGAGVSAIALGCVGIGMGAAYLASRYFSRSEGASPSPQEKLALQMNETLAALQSQNSELKDLLKSNLQSPAVVSPSSARDKAEISELRAELKTLKAMFIDMKSTRSTPQPSWVPSPDTKPSLPSWLSDSTTPLTTYTNSSKTTNGTSNGTLSSKKEETQTTDDKSDSSALGKHPEKFASILSMVQEGKKPADVRDIDDSPIPQNISRSSREAPPKPYQQKKAAENAQTSPQEGKEEIASSAQEKPTVPEPSQSEKVVQ